MSSTSDLACSLTGRRVVRPAPRNHALLGCAHGSDTLAEVQEISTSAVLIVLDGCQTFYKGTTQLCVRRVHCPSRRLVAACSVYLYVACMTLIIVDGIHLYMEDASHLTTTEVTMNLP